MKVKVVILQHLQQHDLRNQDKSYSYTETIDLEKITIRKQYCIMRHKVNTL